MSGLINQVGVRSGVVGRSLDTAKAWVNFDMYSSSSILVSFNVSSLTDHGTGQYSVVFIKALAADYAVCASSVGNTQNYYSQPFGWGSTALATTGFRLECPHVNTNAMQDIDCISCIVFGN